VTGSSPVVARRRRCRAHAPGVNATVLADAGCRDQPQRRGRRIDRLQQHREIWNPASRAVASRSSRAEDAACILDALLLADGSGARSGGGATSRQRRPTDKNNRMPRSTTAVPVHRGRCGARRADGQQRADLDRQSARPSPSTCLPTHEHQPRDAGQDRLDVAQLQHGSRFLDLTSTRAGRTSRCSADPRRRGRLPYYLLFVFTKPACRRWGKIVRWASQTTRTRRSAGARNRARRPAPSATARPALSASDPNGDC